MRRIDLFCKLFGPLIISLVDSGSTPIAIIVTRGMSSVSFLVEYLAIARVSQSIPLLQGLKDEPDFERIAHTKSTVLHLRRAVGMLAIYGHHPAFLPSLSLAFLYLTVLSFSGHLITYLLALGLSRAAIAPLRGIAALFELSATWVGPRLAKRSAAVRAGIWFLNAEFIFIGVACICP
jgi:iron-regulated transporter 1